MSGASTTIGVEEKSCSKCNETLPLSSFGINNANRDGLQSYCKPCYTAYQVAYRKVRKRHAPVSGVDIVCVTCDELKDADEFSANTGKSNGRHSSCKACVNIRAKSRYVENADMINKRNWQREKARLASDPEFRERMTAAKREEKAKWRAKYPWRYRAERVNSGVNKRLGTGHGRGHLKGRELEALVFSLDEKCCRCGSGERLQVDHVVPINIGGFNVIENVQILCKECHIFKTFGSSADFRSP